MGFDINAAEAPFAVAVLLHPHPDYGGNRFHPFIDRLFKRLPEVSVSAVRFNFTTSSPAGAGNQVIAAIDHAAAQWPKCPVILAGYSFGAGVAAMIDDHRIADWYLLAPPGVMLEHATAGDDPRPKTIQVPEHDQFSPPKAIEHLVASWQSTTVDTILGVDHFLGDVEPIVDDALASIRSRADAGREVFDSDA